MFVYSKSYSKWEKIRTEKDFTEYFALDNIKKLDSTVYLWSMKDYKKPQKDGYISFKFYTGYNCDEIKYQIFTIVGYKNKMGKGRNFEYIKNIQNLDTINWIIPIFESEDAERVNFICSY